ncbi:MAG: DNA polymerase I [Gammaproteobacteria bacterium]|nr:DNA polymerase I [Gammaproteobacteria bacterium]
MLVDKSKKNFIIVDGSSYLYRAYYALPHLKNSKGQNTGAIFGVTNMLLKLLKTYNPQHLCMVFDAKGKNFRHTLYKDYKRNRKPMPVELSEQVQPIMDFIRSLGIKILQIPDVEADDVIATLAHNKQKNVEVIISSGDKDLAQLVNKNVTLINSMDDKVLDIDGVYKKFGVYPKQMFDYLVLVGDTSDDIPGVENIGPKTAIKLLNDFETLEGIFKNIDKLKGKIKENLMNSIDTIEITKKLIELKTNLNIEVNEKDYLITDRNQKALSDITTKYDLKTIAESLDLKIIRKNYNNKADYKNIYTNKELEGLRTKLNKKSFFAFDTETTSLDSMEAKLVGVSFSIKPHEAYYIPINHHDKNIDISEKKVLEFLKEVMAESKFTIIGQNIKYDMNVLEKYSIKFNCKIHDTMVMSYVYNSTGKHDLNTLAEKYLNYTTIKYEELAGSGAKQKLFSEIDADKATNYACEDADITLRLYNFLYEKLSSNKEQLNLYEKIELPLVKILSKIELNGVNINEKSLSKQSKSLGERIKVIEKNIYKLAGKEFNISSPKQLQEIFYDVLKLPIIKKTPKGQPSTNEDVMLELSDLNELPKLVLDFRNLTKLKNTYTDRLGEQVNQSTKKLHTSYNQTVTITGRLSSSNPNLQNIPIRTEDGRNIRKTFVASKNHKILSADYSQIELRVMAHLSKDKSLIESFLKSEDIHSETAKEVFSLDKEPTKDQRRAAKTINFGLIYGISSYGLSRQLKIDNNAAKEYIEKYFLRYKGVKKFMDNIKAEAKKNGYVSTILGRRIYLPNITHNNFQIRSASERTAINAPIQGTAADILKIAMIHIDEWMNKSDGKIKMLMQVHDELVFEVENDFLDNAIDKINELMSNCYTLNVPLIVDIGTGDNWDKTH